MASGMGNDSELTYKWARILGIQLRSLGINMNLAPDMDVNNNPKNPVINIRSFYSNKEVVSRMGVSYIKGLQKSKCIAVAKHFPGHGDTNKDSHKTLPVINYTLKRLEKIELPPFIKAVDNGVEAIMTAHISYPKILGNHDSATISPFFLTRILRKKMKFSGLIITDDMEMNAISKRYSMGDAAVRAVLAGADIILISSYGKNIKVIFDAILQAVKDKKIPIAKIDEAVKKIIELKLRYNIIDYRKHKVYLAKYLLTKNDKEYLQIASSVNKKISENALFFYGNKKNLRPAKGVERFFIIKNKILKENISLSFHYKIFGSLDDFKKKVKGKDKDKRKILYYEFGKGSLKKIERVYGFAKQNNFQLVYLLTGNPFPVSASGFVSSMLISFSNTKQSMIAMARVLNGEIEPRFKSDLFLGIKK